MKMPEAEIEVAKVKMAPEKKEQTVEQRPLVFYQPDKFKAPELPSRSKKLEPLKNQPVVTVEEKEKEKRRIKAELFPFTGPAQFALTMMQICNAWAGKRQL